MKTITTIIATIAISLPLTVFAEGGYLWEKNNLNKPVVLKTSVAKKMGHTAAQHKFMMTESSNPSDNNQVGNSHRHVPKHENHMAVDHKRHNLSEEH